MVDMQIIVPSYHNATTDSTISTIAVVTNALFRNCFINNPFLPMIFPFQKNKKYYNYYFFIAKINKELKEEDEEINNYKKEIDMLKDQPYFE